MSEEPAAAAGSPDAGPSPSAKPPRALWWVYAWVFLGLFSLHTGVQDLLSPSRTLDVRVLGGFDSVLILIELALLLPFARRRRWAWAGLTSVLLTDLVTVLSLLPGTYQLLGRELRVTPAPVPLWVWAGLFGVVVLILSTPLFLGLRALWSARDWFGVRRRETWRTLWREGWWLFVPSLVARVGAMVLLMTGRL